MEVSANYDTCIASGNCGYIAPGVFQNLEEHGGFVSLKTRNPPESDWPAARRARRLCPSGTIFLTGDVAPYEDGGPGREPKRSRPRESTR